MTNSKTAKSFQKGGVDGCKYSILQVEHREPRDTEPPQPVSFSNYSPQPALILAKEHRDHNLIKFDRIDPFKQPQAEAQTNHEQSPARQGIPAFFLMANLGGDFDLNLALWRDSAQRSHGATLVRTYLSHGQPSIEQAKRDAASAGVEPNIVVLSTTNTHDKNSYEFKNSVNKLKNAFQVDPTLKGSKVLFEWSMCLLVERPPEGRGFLPVTMLMVLEAWQAKTICYTAVQEYFTAAPSPDGSRAAPIWFDASAVAPQMLMPPMKFIQTFLADKIRTNQDGAFAERGTNVYSAGEEIFIFASFDHVGRILPGTPFATYEIGLDIELRNHDGTVITKIANVHTYQGNSTQRFPLDADYFRNHATAGLSLRDAGNYKVVFIFTDRSRPRNETGPIEAVFDITVKQ
ncbi:hypothetical protein IVB23_13400 [Bradyrhizobium sp. 191]|nr:hypothetical protein IVB23_13400 [Bradyrhizobium sp. 191]